MDALFGRWASQGTGLFRKYAPDPQLRAMAQLWPNVEHVVIAHSRLANALRSCRAHLIRNRAANGAADYIWQSLDEIVAEVRAVDEAASRGAGNGIGCGRLFVGLRGRTICSCELGCAACAVGGAGSDLVGASAGKEFA